MRKKLVYICSPLRGDAKKNIAKTYRENIEKAGDYCRKTIKAFPDVIPIAPHIYFTRFLNDIDPCERAQGIQLGLDLLDMCDELWVFGDRISEGMAQEIRYAYEKGIPVTTAVDAFTERVKELRWLEFAKTQNGGVAHGND